ncbi:MAG: hypothetical protein Q4G41_06525, partial [Coriobacteriales bacterium]|nr:hypothetical protein [Coriobacteriales bacterium]
LEALADRVATLERQVVALSVPEARRAAEEARRKEEEARAEAERLRKEEEERNRIRDTAPSSKPVYTSLLDQIAQQQQVLARQA